MKSIYDYLQDTYEYLNDIETFTELMGKEDFFTDRKTQLAVIRAFEVIGEIVKRLPQHLLHTQPEIDWRAIKGFRDILIHQYDNIDLTIVWDAVERVPQVRQAVQALLDSLPDEEGESP